MPSIENRSTATSSLSEPYGRKTIWRRLPINQESFGNLSELIASYLGTSKFIGQMTVFIAIWLLWNTLSPPETRFDPYTFTFLTLLLSLQASYAAPLILLAQNRQSQRDQISLAEDRKQAQLSIETDAYLARELADIKDKLNQISFRISKIEQSSNRTVSKIDLDEVVATIEKATKRKSS